jgi:hypothetical protein
MFTAYRWTRLLSNRRSVQARRMRRRLLLVENLETRTLMAGDTFLDPFGNRIGFAQLAPVSAGQPAPPSSGSSSGGSIGNAAPLSDTFKLHSRPTATKTIYLDFDGFEARGTIWNSARGRDPIISPPYDLDRNGPSFTDNELREIQAAWQRVAADFAAFDVNVTTEDPGEEALVNTGGTDDRWGIRAVITPDDFPTPGSGGVAYIGSFRWNYNKPGATDTPCYVFNLSFDSLAQTVSHEVGHALGLSHDGTDNTNPFQQNAVYYFGHGGTGENSWAPIMGAGFGRNLTTWDNGTYFGSNNGVPNANYGSGPDDLAVITGPANGFGFVPDEFGGTPASASDLSGPIDANSRNVVSLLSTIERSSDLDFFRLQVGAGVLDLTIDPYVTQVWVSNETGSFASSVATAPTREGTNLDIEAKLYDASGNVIAVSNPNALKAEFKSLTLGGGIYYLSVDGVGFGDPRANPPSGYSDYASIGQYAITGSFPVAFGLAVSNASLTFTENEGPKPISDWAKILDNFPGDYSNGGLTMSIQPNSGSTDSLTLDYSGSVDFTQVGAQIFYRGALFGSLSRSSDSSFNIQFTLAATKEAIEAIVKIVRFEARGDTPETFNRNIEIVLTKGLARGTSVIRVEVIAVNDRPIASIAPMNDINEDEVNSQGTRIDSLIDRGVIDVDGTQGKAIVITGIPASPGKWQFNAGSVWTDVGTVSQAQGLVLGTSARLRFVPSKDFFGPVPALKYYALDPTYSGAVSTATKSVYENIANVLAPDSISATAGDIRQNVRPINDPPMAQEPFPSASVLQDQSLLFTLPANLFRDVDDTRMTLSAFVGPGVPLPNWLSFDPNTGTFSGIPRNKDVGVRQVIVRAQDPSGAFGDAPVTIDVINVNDAPTSIQLTGSPVPENTFAAFVGRLAAIDPDVNDTISWVVLNDPMNRFEVRGNDLYLTAQSKLDFEMERSISFTIRALDNGTPRLSLDKAITIAVADVNEFAPNLGPVSFSISESVSAGSEVGRVVATDGDSANTVRYRFFGTPPEEFLISETGILTVNPGMSLDFETKPIHRFFVQAYDDGVPSLSTWVSASVTVTNANEFAPDIVTDTLVVSENYPLGVAVARVVATDRDTETVRFSLLPSETRFTINPSTGDLSLAQPGLLDFERSRNEFLTVIATDTGTPSRSTQKTVTIAVANANEPPTSVSVERSRVPANVAGFDLGKITIQDPDGPTTYAITPFDERLQVVAGNLVFKSGRSFVEADPQFVLVTLLLNDVAGGIAFQSDIQLERISNPTPWQNPINPFDVDRDGSAGPLDALSVVNAINSGMDSRLTFPRPSSSLPDGDIDVDGDGRLTPLDALALVNAINSGTGSSLPKGGEGESVAAAVDGYFASYDIESDSQLSRSRRVARFRNS